MSLELGGGTTSEGQRHEALPANMNVVELDELFASCMPQLQRIARRVIRNPQDSEDALQEGLLLAVRNLHQFEGRSSFCTWLHTIVKNAALSHARRMNSRPKCSLEVDISDETAPGREELFVDPGLSPEEECSRRERSRILREVIKELPSRYEFAIRLCYFDGVEVKDAARKIGVTPCALKTHLFRARQRTVRRVREMCFTPAKSSPERALPGIQQPQESGLLRKASSISGVKHSKREHGSLNSKPRKKIEFGGGNYDTKEKKSRFWERSMAPPAQSLVHGTNQPAC